MVNRQNYKDVCDYLIYHERILQNKKATLDTYENQLRYALRWADEVPFSEFPKIKKTFPMYLREMIDSGEIKDSWGSDICVLFRDFLEYNLTENKSRYSGIKHSQIDEIRIITHTDSTKTADYYTLTEMEKIAKVEVGTGQKALGMKRAKASACFLFLSGMRISAYLSMPIECVDLDHKTVHQFPELGVVTKFSKKASTTLLPIPFLMDVVSDWEHTILSNNIPSNALWYSDISKGGKSLLPTFPIKGNHNKAYRTARTKGTKFRERYLQDLCLLADIEYKSPHAFRHGHVHWGLSHAKSMEQVKAISQNVMHNSTAITDEIYSRMNYTGMSKTIAGLGEIEEKKPIENKGITAKEILSVLSFDEKKKLFEEMFGL